MYESILSRSTTLTYIPAPEAKQGHILPQQNMGIEDSDATYLYISISAPHGPPNTIAAIISVGTENLHVEHSPSKATLPLPQLAADIPTTGYIMPSFANTVVGVGPICYAYCTVVFTKQDVTVLSPNGNPILTGWRENKIPII